MNHVVAYELLAAELAAYRTIDFEQLRQLVGERTSHLKRAGNGIEYEIKHHRTLVQSRGMRHPRDFFREDHGYIAKRCGKVARGMMSSDLLTGKP